MANPLVGSLLIRDVYLTESPLLLPNPDNSRSFDSYIVKDVLESLEFGTAVLVAAEMLFHTDVVIYCGPVDKALVEKQVKDAINQVYKLDVIPQPYLKGMSRRTPWGTEIAVLNATLPYSCDTFKADRPDVLALVFSKVPAVPKMNSRLFNVIVPERKVG